jgi:N-acetylmuramoyl-L-alanine amidase
MHLIAEANCFFWETLWKHPENDGIREARRDPNVLLPGDKVFIPELRLKEESGATEQRHRFKRKGVPARLKIQVQDEDQPLRNEKYYLDVDGRRREGTTDGSGGLDEPMPCGARRAVLTVRPNESPLRYEIDLGGLDPHDSVRGVQARLKNLGYPVLVAGELDAPTVRAVRAFQQDQRLNVSGIVTEETCLKLKEIHGS